MSHRMPQKSRFSKAKSRSFCSARSAKKYASFSHSNPPYTFNHRPNQLPKLPHERILSSRDTIFCRRPQSRRPIELGLLHESCGIRGRTLFFKGVALCLPYRMARRLHQRFGRDFLWVPSFLDVGPVKQPRAWLAWVDQALTAPELEALRRSLNRWASTASGTP